MHQGHNSEATGGIQKEVKDEEGRPEGVSYQHRPDEVASMEYSREIGYRGLETTTLINKGSGVEKCTAGTEERY